MSNPNTAEITPDGPNEPDEFAFDWSTVAPRPGVAERSSRETAAAAGPDDVEGDFDLSGFLGGEREDGGVGGGGVPNGGASIADPGRPTSAPRPVAMTGVTPIWHNWHEYSTPENPHLLRVYRHLATGRQQDLGELPASASRIDILERWGPGTYLAQPVTQFGEPLNISGTPWVLDLPADHMFLQDRRGGAPVAAPAATPMPMYGSPSLDPVFGYLGRIDESRLAKDLADRDALRAREVAAMDAATKAAEAQAGLADRMIMHQTDLSSKMMDTHARRLDQQAASEREWWAGAAQRDRAALSEARQLQESGMTLLVTTMTNNLEQERMREERRRVDEKAEREERYRLEREVRDRAEAAERLRETERERIRAEDAQRAREHMAAMQQLMMAQTNASNPMNAIMAVGSMLAPALLFAEKLGVLDVMKDKLKDLLTPAEKEETGSGSAWADVIKEAVKQGGETVRAITDRAAFIEEGADDEEEEDEDEDGPVGPLRPRPDGLLQDEEGGVFTIRGDRVAVEPIEWGGARGGGGGGGDQQQPPRRPQAPRRREREKVPVEVNAGGGGGGGEQPQQQPQATAQQPAAQQPAAQQSPETIAAAQAAHASAYRDVGGPAAIAAMGRTKTADAKPTKEHPADAAGIDPKAQKTARAVMKELVRQIRTLPEAKWQEVTIKAVNHNPEALGAYLTAMSIRKAAEEAGADDSLINRYIKLLNAIEGPLALVIKDIPRG